MGVGRLLATPAGNVGIILVATVVIWVGSGWLENAAERLSLHYGLPPVIQGSVVVAVGSSFPELASIIVTALSGVFEMGIGTIVGSAIFNILVVPALAGLATPRDAIETNRALVYKEAQFYMIAVSAIVIAFALAVIYAPTGDGALKGELTRPIVALPLALYGMYIFIQWVDISDYDAVEPPETIAVKRNWMFLVAGLAAIGIAVHFFVGAVESMTVTFGISEFIAGVLIVAGATSLPDTIVSVKAARERRGLTSLANVLGSNTFNLLVAIPIGVVILGSVPVNFAMAAPMFGLLTIATMLLFVVLRTDLTLTARESYLLLGAYVVFVGWTVGETVGVVDFLAGT